jgi:hypothetical protein
MSRRLWLIIVGLGAVAATFLLVRSRVRGPSADESARLKALEARLALLEKQGYRSQVITRTSDPGEGHLVVPTPPAGMVTAGQAVAGPAPHKPVHLDEVAIQREYFGDLDVRLAGEGRDPGWSVVTEEKLRGSVEDLRPRITVENAQCGQTMCRVETTVPEPREDAAALEKFISTSLALLSEAVVRDGDGPGRHIVYFARKGSEFPPMNAPEGAAQ